jgi:outer membrane receptor protein involved in Fe transport
MIATAGGILAAGICRAETGADAAGETGLAEITITAERTRSTVQDTPISISALSGEQLSAAGITTVEDIAHDVPGLSMRSAGPGLTEYEARGLASNGGAAPTVGFYLDEIPLSPPALSQSGKVVIDPDLYDVERVEVLRGPQGTLYGSGSMGGTIKVITNQPKLSQFEASAQATLSDTQGGGGNGGANFMLNIPLGSVLALRAVGSDVYRSGWIDNITVSPFPVDLARNPGLCGCIPARGPFPSSAVTNVIHRANDERKTTARAALLFQPREGVSITLSAMTQHMALGGYDLLDGSPQSAAPAQLLNAHYEAFPFRESVHDDIHIYGITGVFDIGFADLTSATAYWDRLGWQTQDASESIYWSNNNIGATGTPAPAPIMPLALVPYSEKDPARQFSQELRLTSHDVGGFHWVAGAFYSRLRSVWIEISSSSLNTFVPNGVFFDSFNPYVVKQAALFADGSYKITSALKLSAGLRWYNYKSQQDELSWGYDGPNVSQPAYPQTTRASDRGFNPRVNLSYEPNKDLMLYGTASKGFRPGGANQILPPPNLPPFCQNGALSFGPDTVWNFELGEKARLFDNWLTINGDIYYIKWKGIQQVITLPCGYQYYNNAGDARSFGPELEINARLSTNWSVSLSGAYTDAKITSPNASYASYLTGVALLPDGVTHPCGTSAGCTAPVMNVVKDTASASLVYTTALSNNYQFTARITDSFIGPSQDVAYFFGYRLPSYNLANARLILAHDSWSVHLFVDNLTNKTALITANNTSFQFNIPQLVRYSTNQPRTFGTQIDYHF